MGLDPRRFNPRPRVRRADLRDALDRTTSTLSGFQSTPPRVGGADSCDDRDIAKTAPCPLRVSIRAPACERLRLGSSLDLLERNLVSIHAPACA